MSEAPRQRDDDLRWVLSTEQGRRFVLRLIESEAQLHSLSFGGDERATCFREGQRSVGAWLLEESKRVDPHAYMRALNEQFAAFEAELAKSK